MSEFLHQQTQLRVVSDPVKAPVVITSEIAEVNVFGASAKAADIQTANDIAAFIHRVREQQIQQTQGING
jgi:hypothetical protein